MMPISIAEAKILINCKIVTGKATQPASVTNNNDFILLLFSILRQIMSFMRIIPFIVRFAITTALVITLNTRLTIGGTVPAFAF